MMFLILTTSTCYDGTEPRDENNNGSTGIKKKSNYHKNKKIKNYHQMENLHIIHGLKRKGKYHPMCLPIGGLILETYKRST